ncbi:hypothetical protein [Cohaesibacter celericrescens]|uniref:hypothetical protein n=1 Tax=Cohaesibacter celericrescens TaxID=2067669 RepID=UPI0015E0F431|nr:hypothetical protein [Cohaesibacter celericrescens]
MDNIPTSEQKSEVNRIIYWSAGILSFVAILGLAIWSQAGAAVYFDRISGAFMGCF